MSPFRQQAPSHCQRRQHRAERGQQGAEIDTSHGAEKPAIALVELAAPQRHVEIVSHRRKIAVDRRRLRATRRATRCAQRTGPELHVQLGHAVRRHAKRDEILAHVAGFEMPRVKARQQFVRTRGQRACLARREEVDRLTRNSCDFREHRPQALVDGAQELHEFGAHVILR